MFFEGNAVFIDHGDGLISMYFHLSDIKVQAGQEVKKGDTLGREGSTGRATGPHLWFGVRWHDARINPKFLLEAPGQDPCGEPSAAIEFNWRSGSVRGTAFGHGYRAVTEV